MTSNARIFFAGVGTTLAIIAAGFGGGVLLASSGVKESSSLVPANSHTARAARVVYPVSKRPETQVAQPDPVQQVPTPEPPQAQPNEHHKTWKELWTEKRRERAERRAERRARRHHDAQPEQQAER